jgi:hypothetical protein
VQGQVRLIPQFVDSLARGDFVTTPDHIGRSALPIDNLVEVVQMKLPNPKLFPTKPLIAGLLPDLCGSVNALKLSTVGLRE